MELAELFVTKALGSLTLRLDDDFSVAFTAAEQDPELPHTGKAFDNALFHFANALTVFTVHDFRRNWCECTLGVARLLAVRADRLASRAMKQGGQQAKSVEGGRIEKDYEMAIGQVEEFLYTITERDDSLLWASTQCELAGFGAPTRAMARLHGSHCRPK